LICSHKDECGDEACPHAQPHNDCTHTCQRVAGARCVVDVESLPEIRDTLGTTVAIFIRRREKAD
jgi:hypothetical protein